MTETDGQNQKMKDKEAQRLKKKNEQMLEKDEENQEKDEELARLRGKVRLQRACRKCRCID